MDRNLDEVEVLLDMWAESMRHPEPVTEGYPEKAAGGFIASWIKESDEIYEAAELDRLARIDAAFDSLQPRYKDVIYKRYSLNRSGTNVWRFAQPATFEEAKAAIRPFFVSKNLL